jgi:hypothetical protein
MEIRNLELGMVTGDPAKQGTSSAKAINYADRIIFRCVPCVTQGYREE